MINEETKNGEVTFIHIPKAIDGNPEILIMPIGLVALADFLTKNGLKSEIIHPLLEKQVNSKFDLIEYVKSKNKRIFCFDLHWHYQAYNVMNAIKEIKEKISDSYVIVGGFTASFFAKEILEMFPAVDSIILGDAEIPLLELIKKINSNATDCSSVPNLVWRSKNKIKINNQKYTINQETIDSLSFSNFKLLKNYQKYDNMVFSSYNSSELNKKNRVKPFFYNCGRGCSVNCSFCGGSNTSQIIINCRKDPIFINPDSVIRDIKNVIENYKLNIWYCGFDPEPEGNYYLDLFDRIRKEKLEMGSMFECWALPSKEFIDKFLITFNQEKSVLIISPESGSDVVRKKNKGFFYSNKEFLEMLQYAYSKGVYIRLYFAGGFPYEEKKDIVKTLKLINFIKNKFKKIVIFCSAIEFEPAAPWFLEREKYGISSKRKTFKDYYDVHQEKSDIGYSTENFNKEEVNEIIKLYQAESKCFRNVSFFLKKYLGDVSNYDFTNSKEFCRECKDFNKCSS